MVLREGRAYFLSDAFFDKYPSEQFPEIEAKRSRPYVFYVVELEDGVWFAIPLRSHVKHPYVFRTSASGGLDYSKAVPILDESFVDATRRAYVRSAELPLIRKNRGAIKDGLRTYIEQYREARRHPRRRRNARLIGYSTLQYFEEELGLA